MMPSWSQLLILVAVVVLLFGTKKLRTLGSDLGMAIKGFKQAMNEDSDAISLSDKKLTNLENPSTIADTTANSHNKAD